MSCNVIEIKCNGARRKILVQEYMPVYYPNIYVTLEKSNRALNTQYKYLEHIGLLEEFLKYESIDLIERLEKRPKSQYLTDSEVSRFVSDAALNKKILDKKYTGLHLLPAGYETVCRTHAQQRLETIRDYLKFLYDKLGDEATRDEAVDDIERRFIRKIKAARPAWKKRKNEEIKGLDNHERNLLLKVMDPENSMGPFANKSLRLRNYIILLLGLEVGLRRSEMLLIKLGDIHWHTGELSIVNLEYEEIELRALAPQFKTHERILQISDELIWALKEYIDTYRIMAERTSEAKNHPFLLVSHRRNEGNPLSIKALDGVFPRVGKVVPELAHIHPHILRHDSVFTMLESMREDLEKLTPEDRTTQIQKVLTWMFGWSPESNMPSLYGAKFWKEEADKALKIRANKFKTAKKSVGTKMYTGSAE